MHQQQQHPAEKEFHIAYNLAAWSFLGIVIPLVGVTGIVALSKLSGLVANNANDEARLRNTRNMAKWGIGLTIASFVITCILWTIFMFGFIFSNPQLFDPNYEMTDQTVTLDPKYY